MSKSRYIVQDAKEGQIELSLLWHVFISNIWKILIVAVLAAGLLGVFRYFTYQPYYTADIQFLVTGKNIGYRNGEYVVEANASSGSTVGAEFAKNAPVIIKEDNTLQAVRENLVAKHGDKYSHLLIRNLNAMVSVSVNEQHVTVRISHPNERTAMDVAAAFEAEVPARMDYYYGIRNDLGTESLESVAKALNTVSEDELVYSGRSTVLTYAIIGAFLGAIAVYLICFLRSFFDNTVYSEDDLKENFTLPIIGQIPDWNVTVAADSYGKQGSNGKVNHANGQLEKNASDSRNYAGRLLNSKTPFAISEAFKSLRTNMCYTTKGEKCAVYGITSAYVQAGKSLVIANLAVSFAMMGKKVLLLDGDLRCPVQHKIFGLSNHIHGFSDALAGICSYEEIELRNAGHENLHVLTCGKLPPNPAELLASENMKSFIERAKEEYDIVFIDLPPVSEVSDVGIISELVTGFIFVVRAGYSDRRMVEMAVESMDGFGASLTGFILNDVDLKSGRYYKNKYYRYGFKYGRYNYRYGRKYGRRAGGKYGSYGDYSNSYAHAVEQSNGD